MPWRRLIGTTCSDYMSYNRKLYLFDFIFNFQHGIFYNLELASRQQCPSITDQASPAYGRRAASAAAYSKRVTYWSPLQSTPPITAAECGSTTDFRWAVASGADRGVSEGIHA